MPKEIELKFKVPDLAGVRAALRRAGGRPLGAVLQRDCYFDTPEGSLLASDRGLRLRTVRPLAGGRMGPDVRPQLTFKGPADPSSRAKSRRELQVRLDDAEAARGLLAGLGLALRLTLEKRRRTWRLGRCVVCLDELPVLGCFVEIEGPGLAAIESVRRRLGLAGAPIRDHYVRLLEAARPGGLRPGCRITFSPARRGGR